MSEHHKADNGNFDEFIRKKLDEQAVEFDPAAWKAMEKKLDSYGKGGGGKFASGKWTYLVIAFLFISAISTVFMLNTSLLQKKEVQQEKIFENGPADVLPGVDPIIREIDSSGNEKNAGTVKSGKDTNSVDPSRRQTMAGGDEKDFFTGAFRGEIQEQNTGFRAGKKPFINAESKWKEKRNETGYVIRKENVAEKNSGVVGEDNSLTALTQEKLNPIKGEGTGNATEVTEKSKTTSTLFRLSEEGEAFPLIQKKEALALLVQTGMVNSRPLAARAVVAGSFLEEELKTEEASFLPEWNIYLTVAPDFTGTGEDGSTKAGGGAGLLLEYRALKNWSLLTGVFYSRKNYLAANGHFYSYGGQYYYPQPDYIKGSCGIIDIPLNLRYYVWNGGRHNFFFSAGISSYLMSSEAYEMVYTDKRQKNYNYEVRWENRHLAAVYNLSFGYELAFPNKWSLQLEPFLKIPGRGIGEGAVKLNSIGSFLHLKYRIGR